MATRAVARPRHRHQRRGLHSARCARRRAEVNRVVVLGLLGFAGPARPRRGARCTWPRAEVNRVVVPGLLGFARPARPRRRRQTAQTRPRRRYFLPSRCTNRCATQWASGAGQSHKGAACAEARTQALHDQPCPRFRGRARPRRPVPLARRRGALIHRRKCQPGAIPSARSAGWCRRDTRGRAAGTRLRGRGRAYAFGWHARLLSATAPRQCPWPSRGPRRHCSRGAHARARVVGPRQ